MTCVDTREKWAYTPEKAKEVLEKTHTLVNAQEYFSFWDRHTNTVHEWREESGVPFTVWLIGLDNEALVCWQRHVISSANAVLYNNGSWGPLYITFNPRGQYITWPGPFSSTWVDGKVTETWEVPRYPDALWLNDRGGDDSGRYTCWYYVEV